MASTVFVNVQSMVKRKRRKVMKKFKVTVTSGHKKIYYVEAEDWEEAEEMIFSPTGIHSERDPDFEEFESDKIETEEVE